MYGLSYTNWLRLSILKAHHGVNDAPESHSLNRVSLGVTAETRSHTCDSQPLDKVGSFPLSFLFIPSYFICFYLFHPLSSLLFYFLFSPSYFLSFPTISCLFLRSFFQSLLSSLFLPSYIPFFSFSPTLLSLSALKEEIYLKTVFALIVCVENTPSSLLLF